MGKTSKQRILELAKQGGLISAKDLIAHGLPRELLARMAAQGTLERVSKGLYGLPSARKSPYSSLAEVAAAVPKGVICLLSALRFHGLTTQLSPDVWVAVPGSTWRPVSTPFPVRYVHMAGKSFQAGVEHHIIDRIKVAVFCPAKTVADCFKYRNKIGIDVALEALQDYLKRHRGGRDELWRFAEVCRVARVIRPYLDAML